MKNLSLISAVLMPFLTMAHEGHGTIQHGLGHYLTSPIHIVGVLALACIAAAVYVVRRNKKRHA